MCTGERMCRAAQVGTSEQMFTPRPPRGTGFAKNFAIPGPPLAFCGTSAVAIHDLAIGQSEDRLWKGCT